MIYLEKTPLQSNPAISNNQEETFGGQALPLDLFEAIMLILNIRGLQNAACLNKYWNDKTVRSVKAHKALELSSQIAKINHDLALSTLSDKTTYLFKNQLSILFEYARISESSGLKEIKYRIIDLREKIIEKLKCLNFHEDLKILPEIILANFISKDDSFIRTISDENLKLLANELADFGQTEKAIFKMNLIWCQHTKNLTSFHILEKLIEMNKFNEFFAIIGTTFGENFDRYLICKLPILLSKLNSAQEIKFAEALASNKHSDYVNSKIISSVKTISKEVSELFQFEQLIKIAKFITDSHNKTDALKLISLQMEKKGFWNEANQLNGEKFEKNDLLMLSNTLTKSGHSDQAARVANAISFTKEREMCIAYIEKHSSIEKSQISKEVLSNYVIRLTVKGYIDFALMLASLMPDEELKDLCLRDITMILAKNRYFDKAIEVANVTPSYIYKYVWELHVLSSLVLRLAKAGFRDKAFEIANYIPSEALKAYTLKNLEALTL